MENRFKTDDIELSDRLFYTSIYNIVDVVCTVIAITVCLYVFLGVCISCFKKSDYDSHKSKRRFRPSRVLFNNSSLKALEDGVYLSEISPSSSDNLSNASSLNSRGSNAGLFPEDTSKLWISFPMTLRRKFRQKGKNEEPTTVKLCLKHNTVDEQTKTRGKLHISIRDILSLPIKDYPRYTEAYLIIRLIKYERSVKGRDEIIIYENRTRNFRNTRDIKIDEHFVIDTKKSDWKNWNLMMVAYDQDMYTKPGELASATLPLSSKFKEILSRDEGVEIVSQLKRIPKNFGHLLVGLSYLPTSQRLSVNIVKVVNLPDKEPKNGRTYAQLFLLTGVTGRSLKRKKIVFYPPDNNPAELNGTLSFDITPCLLETVTLLVILYREVSLEHLGYEKNTLPENNEMGKSAKYNPVDHCYGSVAIGNMVSNSKGKKHWRMMMMAPRRVVTVWHSLK